MAQQTSALTHLRLDAGSMAVTHSDTSKQSLAHSISIIYLPWLTWISTAQCTSWSWGSPPGHSLPVQTYMTLDTLAGLLFVLLHHFYGIVITARWNWKRKGASITYTLPHQGICYRRCQIIYFIQSLVCFERTRSAMFLNACSEYPHSKLGQEMAFIERGEMRWISYTVHSFIHSFIPQRHSFIQVEPIQPGLKVQLVMSVRQHLDWSSWLVQQKDFVLSNKNEWGTMSLNQHQHLHLLLSSPSAGQLWESVAAVCGCNSPWCVSY